MADNAHRHATGPGTLSPLVGAFAGLIVAAAVIFEAAAQVGAKLDHWRHHPPVDPALLAIDLGRHKLRWPAAGTPVAVGLAALVLALLAALAITILRRRTRRTHVDRAAGVMGRGRALHRVSLKNAKATAKRFGVDEPGLPVGRAVGTGQPLYATWEDLQCDIWGPRTGKTTSRAVPTLLTAPGPAFATSNKPDLHGATRLLRERVGQVWNFDPERLAGGTPTWWWNPLSYVTSDRRALELTEAFVGATRHPDARTDAFFDPAGRELVSNFLRAAALDERPITQALMWTLRPNDDEPAQILSEHGLELAAASVLDNIHSAPDQRSGVYRTGVQILSFLQDPDIAQWVVAGEHDHRPHLDLAAFAQSSDTLYLHSKEGKGSSAGLVTALAMALCDAAEQHAKRSPGGRLPVPMVGVLDEAANICRWQALPDLYSHYGSRGISLLTLLQSWSQGTQVWGDNGMRKLWGSSNVRVYGGGASEQAFLSDLEKLIGDYNRMVASPNQTRSSNGSSSSTNWQLTPTPILTIAELAALPAGRTIVMPSGAPPVLAEPVPWWQTAWASEIEKSIALYANPTPPPTAAVATAAPSAKPNPWIRT
jgi:type IV secretory pathway TraG/TraD family ATPase VirD4